MTNQQAYDKATRGLLFQGERCELQSSYPPFTLYCAFTNKKGQHCALGFLLPDSITHNRDASFVFLNKELDNEFQDDLRNVHNEHQPNEWPTQLRSLAWKYSLSTKVLDETLAELAELDSLLKIANQPERSGDRKIAECVSC